MSRGYRSNYVALGLAVAIYLVWIAPLAISFLPTLRYHPGDDVSQTEREQRREEQDTYAQIWVAWAAWAQVTVGFIGLIGLGATVYYAREAWKESQRATANAREQFELERRAWLSIKVEAQRIAVSEERRRAACVLRIRAENIGASPALSVAFWVNDQPLDFWEEGAEIKDLAERIEHARTQPHPFGGYIFPHEDRQKFATIHIDSVPRDWPGSFFFIAGWVQYRLKRGGPSHFTPFGVQVLYSFNETENRWVAYTEMMAVPIAPD